MLPVREIEKMGGEIIRVEHLKKYFPVEKGFLERLFARTKSFVKAVDDISFSIQDGEVFTLAGESGCGKSTTGKVITKLIPLTSGKVYLKNEDISSLNNEEFRNRRRKLQIIFQDPYASLNPRMTVGDAIAHPLSIHRLASGEEAKKRVAEMLEAVGLTPPEQFVDLYPYQLSGGQRQRVAMARSLVLEPEFIVADEPVSMIDVSLRATIVDLMLKLRRELGLTYLFITHDLAIAKYISDRIAIMYLGRIVEMGDKHELFSHPLHPYTKALMSSIPVPDPEYKRVVFEIKGEVPSAITIPRGCRFNTRCPYAEEKCRETEPELVMIGPKHQVACLLAET
jgi:peptide/nickel transport system ATP-binding protein